MNRTAQQAAPRDILKLRRCPDCGYDLTGLPRRHHCPECGFEYDEAMFALYGWKDALHRFKFSYWLLLCLLGLPGLALGSGAITWWFGNTPLAVLFVALGGPIFFFILLLLVYQFWSRARGDSQWLFSAAGVRQRRRAGRTRFIAWRDFQQFRFQRVRLSGRGWRLQLGLGRLLPFLVAAIDGVFDATRREAALVRRELRRRLRAAHTDGSGPGV